MLNKVSQNSGQDYLKDLIDRNLILADKDFSKVGIHEVLRELCLKIAEKEMFFYVVETPQAICREREVDIPIVRSLRWPAKEDEVSVDLRLLRVLYKNDEYNGSYLEANLEQLNLRYLLYARNNLYKYTWSDTLTTYPERTLHLSPSISLLWNLQTLFIGGNSISWVAPYEIWEMLQLRHVDVISYIHLPSVKSELGDDLVIMRNLRTLKRVKNFKMSEEVCRRVPNIKELVLGYDDSDEECDEVRSYYCPHNLGSFRKLESLKCKLGKSSSLWREFGLSLTFPSSLKKLSLEYSHLEWEEMAEKVGSLTHLETLRLGMKSVISSKWNVEGKFLRLKNLEIGECYELEYWNAEHSCFPVLEKLLLGYLNLYEFPSGIVEIPTLRSIVLEGCNVWCSISAVRVVVEQVEEFGNQDLRLQVCIIDDWKRERLKREVEKKGLTNKNVSIHEYISD